MDRSEQAVALKHGGCNCCQAVLAAYEDQLGLDRQTLLAMGAAFGTGMGCLESTCGALCGAQMILGCAQYAGRGLHAQARAMLESFRQEAGATICRELKGVGTGRVLCACDECVRIAARLAGEALEL